MAPHHAGGQVPKVNLRGVHVSAEEIATARGVGASLVGEIVVLSGAGAPPGVEGCVGLPTSFSFASGVYSVTLEDGRCVEARPTSVHKLAAARV